MSEFAYLGSKISSDGALDIEVEKCVATESRAFGALRHAVFQDRTLSITTKRLFYQACIFYFMVESVGHSIRDILFV